MRICVDSRTAFGYPDGHPDHEEDVMRKPTRRVAPYAHVSTGRQLPWTANSSDEPTTVGNSASPVHIER
jgi:hypothetical protein